MKIRFKHDPLQEDVVDDREWLGVKVVKYGGLMLALLLIVLALLALFYPAIFNTLLDLP